MFYETDTHNIILNVSIQKNKPFYRKIKAV